MPIYEYSCPKCGDFDQMQKITDPPLRKCPTCKAKITKLISNPAFHLKGGGWYITDYGRKGGGSGAAESKSDDSGSSSSESSSEGSGGDTKEKKKDKKADKKGTSASAAA
jgi:putative FmdB family regulatory protein